jgi:ATP-binding cassette subfamily F protein 3
MLHLDEISLRLSRRLILDRASAVVPEGHRVGLVGRNGSGKTSLLRLISAEMIPEHGRVRLPRHMRIGTVAQEAPGGQSSLVDTVLAGDRRRSALLSELEKAADGHRIAEIHTRLGDIDAYSASARAKTILSGLGFREDLHGIPCAELPGGWRMRVALAAALFSNPELLLLDEPTNYLDLEGTIWLRSFIRNYRYTAIVVSHDRDFLNQTVNSILHLDRGKLHFYSGDFDSFEMQRRERRDLIGKLKKKQDKQRQHLQSFVDRFRYKQSKARQAQSRLKAIAKLKPIAEIVDDRVGPFAFPDPQRPLNPPLMRLDRVTAGYQPDRPILSHINVQIDTDDRIALLGPNGNGKSTFAKLLSGRLPAVTGSLSQHPKLRIGYFAQHQLEELDGNLSPYEYFSRLMPTATETQRRARLAMSGLGTELADARSATLSGGETTRLLLALATCQAQDLLILDEPTNHLDIDSRAALVLALNTYRGAVILISHDQHLIETVAEQLWLVAEGTVKPFDGDLNDYAQYVLGNVKPGRDSGGEAAEAASRQNGRNQRRVAASERARMAPMHKKMAEIEAAMAMVTEKIRILDRALGDAELYQTERIEAQRFAKKRAQLAAQLRQTESQWLEAYDELQSLERKNRTAES